MVNITIPLAVIASVLIKVNYIVVICPTTKLEPVIERLDITPG